MMKKILCLLFINLVCYFQFNGFSERFNVNVEDSITNNNPEGGKTLQKVRTLQELKVTAPKKYKTVKFGKKHRGGMMKSVIFDGNGDSITGRHPMKGYCTGFRIKSSEEKPMWLKSVGFYIENQKQTAPDEINFKINFYDASLVEDKCEKTSDFILTDIPPVYFQYTSEMAEDGKFTFVLPEPILLPSDAMIELEYLEDLGDKYIIFKSNLLGKSIWNRERLKDPERWIKIPFATNFFIECIK